MRLGPSLIGAVVGGVIGVAAQIGFESSIGPEASWFAIIIGLLTGLGARAMAGEGIRKASIARAALAGIIGLAAIVGGSYAASEVVRKKNSDAYDSADSEPIKSDANADKGKDESTDDAKDADAASADDSNADDTAADEADKTDDSSAASDADAEDTGNAADDAESADATDKADDATDEDKADEPTEPAEKKAPPVVDLSKLNDGTPVNTELPPPSPLQYVFFGVGTLLAYELARGSDKKTTSEPS